MTFKEFNKILNQDNTGDYSGDNALQGLNIIAKYFKNDEDILTGADHDIIYSVSVDDLIKAKVTEEDARALRWLNWMIEDEYLACYV